ncbi:MAG: rRNA maturation RNase YbeY [Planctomycetaceae bacterium]|nr:rRNA maturation RNase YbeY [Planctomycetaceae bacterium]
MYSIRIANQQRALRIDRARLLKLATQTLKAEKVRAAEISIALVDDAEIHRINREFLGHDYPTDVISFLLESEAPKRALGVKSRRGVRAAPVVSLRGAGKSLHGEIIISVETAVEMAGEYGWRPANELFLYLVHGLLHLCGYDDLTSVEQHVMRSREIDVLGPWKIIPHYAM